MAPSLSKQILFIGLVSFCAEIPPSIEAEHSLERDVLYRVKKVIKLSKHQTSNVKGQRRRLMAAAAFKRLIEQHKLAQLEVSKRNKFYYFDPRKPQTRNQQNYLLEARRTSHPLTFPHTDLWANALNSRSEPFHFTFPILLSNNPTQGGERRVNFYDLLDQATNSKNPLEFDFASPDVFRNPEHTPTRDKRGFMNWIKELWGEKTKTIKTNTTEAKTFKNASEDLETTLNPLNSTSELGPIFDIFLSELIGRDGSGPGRLSNADETGWIRSNSFEVTVRTPKKNNPRSSKISKRVRYSSELGSPTFPSYPQFRPKSKAKSPRKKHNKERRRKNNISPSPTRGPLKIPGYDDHEIHGAYVYITNEELRPIDSDNIDNKSDSTSRVIKDRSSNK